MRTLMQLLEHTPSHPLSADDREFIEELKVKATVESMIEEFTDDWDWRGEAENRLQKELDNLSIEIRS